MGFIEAVENIGQHLKADAESVATRLEQDMPEVVRVAQALSSNPAFAALAAAVHVSAAPEVLAVFADLITKADQALAAAKAAGAAEAQAAAVVPPDAPAPA
jgi:hypothetical protein